MSAKEAREELIGEASEAMQHAPSSYAGAEAIVDAGWRPPPSGEVYEQTKSHCAGCGASGWSMEEGHPCGSCGRPWGEHQDTKEVERVARAMYEREQAYTTTNGHNQVPIPWDLADEEMADVWAGWMARAEIAIRTLAEVDD